MKISRDTPEQLIIENNPIWLALVVTGSALVFVAIGLVNLASTPGMGAAFIGGGLVFGVVFNMAFTRRTQLILDRPGNHVELRRRSWFGYSRMTWELQYLQEAVVQASSSGDTDTYRAALVINGGMDAGVFPVTLVYSSGKGAKRTREAINRWIANAP